jgi:NADH:ubiquinone oxidoreductase subunit H
MSTVIEILFFPGFLFILLITLSFEQVAAKLYDRLFFPIKKQPMFIPLVHYFQLTKAKGMQKKSLNSFIQGFLIVFMLAISLFISLLLPINNLGDLPEIVAINGYLTGKTIGITGIISFNGDILLLLALVVLFDLLILFVLLFNKQQSINEVLKQAAGFMVFTIPFFLALVGPFITRKTLSLSVLAEDIRLIILFNKLFGFLLLIPLGLVVSFLALMFKFNQPIFDRINGSVELGRSQSLPENWMRISWHLAMRIMDMVLSGIIVTVFLGGAYLPIPYSDQLYLLTTTLNFVVKWLVVMLLVSLLRIVIPRLKIHQMTNVCWKFLTPLALCSVLLISGYLQLLPLS